MGNNPPAPTATHHQFPSPNDRETPGNRPTDDVRDVQILSPRPPNAFVVAVGWGGNRWVLGIVAALNAAGFSLAVGNVSNDKG